MFSRYSIRRFSPVIYMSRCCKARCCHVNVSKLIDSRDRIDRTDRTEGTDRTDRIDRIDRRGSQESGSCFLNANLNLIELKKDDTDHHISYISSYIRSRKIGNRNWNMWNMSMSTSTSTAITETNTTKSKNMRSSSTSLSPFPPFPSLPSPLPSFPFPLPPSSSSSFPSSSFNLLFSRSYSSSSASSSSTFPYEYKFDTNDGISMRFRLVKLKSLKPSRNPKPKMVNTLLLEFTMVDDIFPYKDQKRFAISPLEAALVLDLSDDEEMRLARSQNTHPTTGEITRPSRSISFYVPKAPQHKTIDICLSEVDPLTGEDRIWGNLTLDRGRAALFRHLVSFSIPKLVENEQLMNNTTASVGTFGESDGSNGSGSDTTTIPRPENVPF